jgi:hypothetical protein
MCKCNYFTCFLRVPTAGIASAQHGTTIDFTGGTTMVHWTVEAVPPSLTTLLLPSTSGELTISPWNSSPPCVHSVNGLFDTPTSMDVSCMHRFFATTAQFD